MGIYPYDEKLDFHYKDTKVESRDMSLKKEDRRQNPEEKKL